MHMVNRGAHEGEGGDDGGGEDGGRKPQTAPLTELKSRAHSGGREGRGRGSDDNLHTGSSMCGPNRAIAKPRHDAEKYAPAWEQLRQLARKEVVRLLYGVDMIIKAGSWHIEPTRFHLGDH